MIGRLFQQLWGRIARAHRATDGGASSVSGNHGQPFDLKSILEEALRHQQKGDLAQAETILYKATARYPRQPDLWLLLGYVLKMQHKLSSATQAFRKSAVLAPDNPVAHFNLADALSAAGDHLQAERALRAALDLRPDFVEALVSLGTTLMNAFRLDEAEDCYVRALQLQRDFAEAHYNYGNLLHREGRTEEAIVSYRRAVALKPDFARAHSNLVYALNFSTDHTLEEIFREHTEWARSHAVPLARHIEPHTNIRNPDRSLRIGYVSANFRNHAVSYFFEPVLENHDRGRFEIYCYSDVPDPDSVTARLRGYPCTWRDIAGESDDAVARLVRQDGIDILVDLTGHTDNHRLLLFARKPAPLQVTWNGYANTTGMAMMDYRITDFYADPPGMTEHLHSEKLLRLPEIYMAFRPPAASPEVAPPPILGRGYVTFGSFNAISKLQPQMIELWSRILSALPAARLMIFTAPEGRTRERLREAFECNGVGPRRLDFRQRLPFREFLAAHNEVDIALDPFPFHGTTTTCHSLWMGVPLVTLAGSSHVSRVGVSMLSNLGLERLIARDTKEYVSLAVALAEDHRELAVLRASLRERMLTSPNTDGARLTHFLEEAYSKIWEDYCSNRAAG